jgi:hypothetical protein
MGTTEDFNRAEWVSQRLDHLNDIQTSSGFTLSELREYRRLCNEEQSFWYEEPTQQDPNTHRSVA